MVFSDEVMLQIELYSVNNECQLIYAGDTPQSVLKKIKEINKTYNLSMGEDFVKILPGKEMIDGKPITKKQLGDIYVCYLDRASKDEIEKMRKHKEEMKNKYTELNDFEFVTFLKG